MHSSIFHFKNSDCVVYVFERAHRMEYFSDKDDYNFS